jgi:GNAT superfamily N-acetyltransferase
MSEVAELCELFPVISELRTSINLNTFLERVAVQSNEGYRLVAACNESQLLAAAGFRTLHCLALGQYMYVEDFVTVKAARKQGIGSALFAWLERYARENGCAAIQLDSGIQRAEAHEFYRSMKMEMTCNHFTKIL